MKLEGIKKERLLTLIQEERPGQIINEVLSFEGIDGYDVIKVEVSMSSDFLGTRVNSSISWIPFPMEEYNKLSEEEQDLLFNKHFSVFSK